MCGPDENVFKATTEYILSCFEGHFYQEQLELVKIRFLLLWRDSYANGNVQVNAFALHNLVALSPCCRRCTFAGFYSCCSLELDSSVASSAVFPARQMPGNAPAVLAGLVQASVIARCSVWQHLVGCFRSKRFSETLPTTAESYLNGIEWDN